MKIYCDGAGWNGRCSRVAIIIEEGGYTKKYYYTKFDKKYTSNEMEYYAVLIAAGLARMYDVIYTDSQLVVKQVSGEWQVKAEHLSFFVFAIQLLQNMKNFEIEWVPREKNLAGQYLEYTKG